MSELGAITSGLSAGQDVGVQERQVNRPDLGRAVLADDQEQSLCGNIQEVLLPIVGDCQTSMLPAAIIIPTTAPWTEAERKELTLGAWNHPFLTFPTCMLCSVARTMKQFEGDSIQGFEFALKLLRSRLITFRHVIDDVKDRDACQIDQTSITTRSKRLLQGRYDDRGDVGRWRHDHDHTTVGRLESLGSSGRRHPMRVSASAVGL